MSTIVQTSGVPTSGVESSGLNYAPTDNRPKSGVQLETDSGILGIPTQALARGLVVAGLFGWVFWHNLLRLWLKTNPFTGEANWSHAVCVPVIGLYYLYIHREDIVRAGPR